MSAPHVPVLRATLLALLSVLGLTSPPARGANQDPKRALDELLATVREQEDRTGPAVFQQIVAHGGPESLRTLKLALRELRQRPALSRAYQAARGYSQQEGMRADALDFLTDEALGARRGENREEAARALAGFAPPPYEALERVLVRSRDEAVVELVAQPLVPRWGEAGDAEAAARILQHARVRTATERQIAAAALRRCQGERVDELLARALLDSGRDRAWRLLLVELLAEREGAKGRKALLEALDDRSPEVRTAALERLGATRDPGLARALRGHLRADDEAELRAAVVALGQVSGSDEAWAEELADLAASGAVGARLGATVALAELRTPQAVETLHELLADTDWRVRAEALQQVGNLRRPASVPVLVARLDMERGRMLHDLAAVLRLVTGEDHGESARRWEAWWADVGAGFEPPSYNEALRREQERRRRRAGNLTASSFYGLDVVSERVCFVVDSSGSMAQRAGTARRTGTGGSTGETRLTVARQELEGALSGLLDGALFNLVLFDSSVRGWSERLVEKDAGTVAEALAFAARNDAAGGTNLFGGLMRAFEDPRVDTVYLLSDGDPSVGELLDPDAIRAHVARLNRVRKVRIHGVAIGQASPLLRGLAADSGGDYVESL